MGRILLIPVTFKVWAPVLVLRAASPGFPDKPSCRISPVTTFKAYTVVELCRLQPSLEEELSESGYDGGWLSATSVSSVFNRQ